MNYDFDWTANAIENFLRERARSGREPEVPFQTALKALNGRGDVDRTPEWVAVAAVGQLVAAGRVKSRVWKRDQDVPGEVLLTYKAPAAGASAMSAFEAIDSRRAVKHFDPEHEMSAAEEARILQAGRAAPTAFNLQHVRFVLVKDPGLRAKVREAAWDQAQVTDCSLLIVLAADLMAWEKHAARLWAGAPREVQDFLLPAIENYYTDKPEVQRDEAMRSCGLAAQNLMLAARALGYDSCPMDGFDFAAVGELLHLPADHVLAMFVAIGKKTKEPWDRPGNMDRDEVVLTDRFPA